MSQTCLFQGEALDRAGMHLKSKIQETTKGPLDWKRHGDRGCDLRCVGHGKDGYIKPELVGLNRERIDDEKVTGNLSTA